MARFWAATTVGRLESGNVTRSASMKRCSTFQPSNLPTFQRFMVLSVFRMCKDRAEEVVEQLRLRGHVAVRIAVDVPGSQLVQRSRFLVGEVQHVTVRVLTRLVEHLLEHV